MGLLGSIIAKGVVTAARNSTIKAVGEATANIVSSATSNSKEKIVIKNDTLYIKPTRSSEEYRGKNALEIARELLGTGFENVNLRPVQTLGRFSKGNYGQISSISINGKSEFLGVKKIAASSYIVIEYYDFKDGMDSSIYDGLERIVPGKVKSIAETMNRLNEICKTYDNPKRFCPYCGIMVNKPDARFCSDCGGQL